MFRHIHFLKSVFLYSISAFGGAQTHFSILYTFFVKNKNYITEEELKEYNAICQLLPGPSSTQTLLLIAFKRGGVSLGLLSLLIWILPATFLMILISFILVYTTNWQLQQNLFLYIQPMAISYILFATYRLIIKIKKKFLILMIVILIAIITFYFFKTPFVFPFLIIGGGIISNFIKQKKDSETIIIKPKKIVWQYLIIFLLIFGVAGFLSEKASIHNWKSKQIFNLFESNYRFGSLVFGGGEVLIPMMYEQYVTRPNGYDSITNKRQINSINKNDFLIGAGLARVLPGPIFSIAGFTGGLIFTNKGIYYQLLGGIIAIVAIFLPGTLLILFFFPIWQNLKKYNAIYKSLEGINIAIIGIMLGSSIYLCYDLINHTNYPSPIFLNTHFWLNIIVIIFVFITLLFKKIPIYVPLIVCLILGILIH